MIDMDQEKTFDRLNWQFLDKVMLKMKFGECFRKWFCLLYTDVN